MEIEKKFLGEIIKMSMNNGMGNLITEKGHEYMFFTQYHYQLECYINKTISKMHKFVLGDLVYFKLKQSDSPNFPNSQIAHSLEFVGNPKFEDMLEREKEYGYLKGKLHKNKEYNYFFKEEISGIILKHVFEVWEQMPIGPDFSKSFLLKFNTKEYEDERYLARNSVLHEKIFLPEYIFAKEYLDASRTLPAIVDFKKNGKIYLRAKDIDLTGVLFLPWMNGSEFISIYRNIKISDELQVKIIEIKKHAKSVVFAMI